MKRFSNLLLGAVFLLAAPFVSAGSPLTAWENPPAIQPESNAPYETIDLGTPALAFVISDDCHYVAGGLELAVDVGAIYGQPGAVAGMDSGHGHMGSSANEYCLVGREYPQPSQVAAAAWRYAYRWEMSSFKGPANWCHPPAKQIVITV